MVELPDLMSAIADQIGSETGIRAADFYPEDVNPPYIFLTLDTVREDTFGFGSWGATINAVVLVSAADARTGQHLVYEYATPNSATSLVRACCTDGTFGVAGVTSTPGEFRALHAEETALYRYYGGVLPLEVTVT